MIAVIRRPYSHRRGHTFQRLGAGRGATAAAPRDELMLSYPHADRRNVEHLPVFPAYLHRPAQIVPAAPATPRLVCDDLVRNRNRCQCRPGMTSLPTGLASAALAQRLRCRLGQPIRARRLRGVLRGLPQPSLQLSDPHPRRTQLRRQRLDQLITLREPLTQLHNRQRLGHREVIDTPDDKIKPPRRPPGDLTSYRWARVRPREAGCDGWSGGVSGQGLRQPRQRGPAVCRSIASVAGC
jgi:hypothetical protein